jgi:hypothetical protein
MQALEVHRGSDTLGRRDRAGVHPAGPLDDEQSKHLRDPRPTQAAEPA